MYRTGAVPVISVWLLGEIVAAGDNFSYSWRYYRPSNTGIQGDYCEAIYIGADGDPWIAFELVEGRSLQEAIAAGGSSLRDYRRSDGELGYFQHAFRVYGREGQPCTAPGCTASLQRIVQSGRSSFFCPVCQR